LAYEVGFQFVDVKACHGYLLHEFLSARSRPGKYGGDLSGRSRLLISVIDRIRDELPQLMVGVRLSVFYSVPYQTSRETGRPMDFEKWLPYEFGFGVAKDDPLAIDLAEPLELMRTLVKHGVTAINVTCGSPYYNPHLQRPAIFPPIDGYLPPEDPLVGVWRQIDTVRQCKATLEDTAGQASSGTVPLVGTGYTYLQDYIPNVAQATVREGWTDLVGLGRMVLAYPEMPADTLAGRKLNRKRICRTFSDCTTAPRNGLISAIRLTRTTRVCPSGTNWSKSSSSGRSDDGCYRNDGASTAEGGPSFFLRSARNALTAGELRFFLTPAGTISATTLPRQEIWPGCRADPPLCCWDAVASEESQDVSAHCVGAHVRCCAWRGWSGIGEQGRGTWWRLRLRRLWRL
jgi:2,4-dienoyl-CoA reductase-like NADH-dependent reductase (Old Yellow Enzyme family)